MKAAPETSACEWLRANGLRLTRGRIALIDTLLHADAPLTLSELHSRVAKKEDSGCDFATVFRFIQILDKKKLVISHSWKDRQLHYELSPANSEPHAHAPHHHHLVCKRCRRVEEIDACTVETLERDLMRQRGYADVSHSLEFFGVCPECQQHPPEPTRKKPRKR